MKEKNIKKLDKGKFLVDFTLNGRRKRITVNGSKLRAEQVLTLEREKIYRERYDIPGKKKRIRFEDYVKIFLESHSRNKKSYQDDVYRTGRLLPFFKGKFLNDISPGDVDRFKLKRKEKPVGNATINRELALLKTMFYKAIASEDYGLDRNPVCKVDFLPENSARKRILTIDEMERLLETASTPWGGCLPLFLVIALNTGMRKSEILTLEWKHVNFEERYLEVTPERSKSGKPRKVPMNDVIARELRQIPKDNKYIFYNPKTGSHIKNLKCTFTRACKAARIKNLTIHDLRHTAISFLVNDCDIDIVTAAKIAGHSRVEQTMGYIHPRKEHKQKGVELLGEIINQARHKSDTQAQPVRIEQPASHSYHYN